MFVLHAVGVTGGRVVLWAEGSVLPARVEGRPGRRVVAHPFAVDGDDLRSLVGGVPGGSMTVRLPSFASGPVASPGLVREGAGRGVVRWREWEVPVVRWDDEVADGLADCRLGASARFLNDVV
ncbi:ATP-dependent helicase, partial [Saccharothrix sp. MB29]|nr:ATP-dependent helicase [Saccharothrix sp. MB29]